MASNTHDPTALPDPRSGPNEKTLHVWKKPIEGQADDGAGGDGTTPGKANKQPTIREAVGMIKTDDFTNVAHMPCARQGLMTGIGAGAGFGGLTFVVRGSIPKAVNWSVGMFLLGSMASYEYCQYLRRSERIQMKRNIEIVSENRREQAKKIAEAREQHKKLEEERKEPGRPWYKVW